MELYTSLTQLKMAMNGGHVPPMTPVPVEIQKYIDPAQTIGMGALIEDEKKGLRCPVRGCDKWQHALTNHLNKKHRGIGGAAAILRWLSIPEGTSLVSRAAKKRFRAGQAASYNASDPAHPGRLNLPRGLGNDPISAKKRSDAARSIHTLNHSNNCPAQVSHRLIDLEHKLRRAPLMEDAEKEFGRAFVKSVLKVYGSWNSAKVQCGLEVHTNGYTKDAIYVALEQWVRRHGRLPTYHEAKNPQRTPIIPAPGAILHTLNEQSWSLAMSHLAFVLGVSYRPIAASRAFDGLSKCSRGHELTPDNIVQRKSGQKCCRKCKAMRSLNHYHGRKTERVA